MHLNLLGNQAEELDLCCKCQDIETTEQFLSKHLCWSLAWRHGCRAQSWREESNFGIMAYNIGHKNTLVAPLSHAKLLNNKAASREYLSSSITLFTSLHPAPSLQPLAPSKTPIDPQQSPSPFSSPTPHDESHPSTH